MSDYLKGAIWLLLCASLLQPGCAGVSQSVSTEGSKDTQDIHEAIFQYLIEKTKTAKFDEIYLRVDGKDPAPEFLARFEGQHPRVQPKSEGGVYMSPELFVDPESKEIPVAESTAPADGSPKSKKSQVRAIVFSLGKIRWHSDKKAEVSAAYDCGMLCAAQYTFVLRKKNNRWVISEARTEWIS